MVSNVLELRPKAQAEPPVNLVDAVTILDRADISHRAAVLARALEEHGLRFIGWPDLATMQPMVDEAGQMLHAIAFGWPEHLLMPWGNLDKALRSPLLRACRVASEPFWINRRGIRTGCKNRLFDPIDLKGFEEFAAGSAAIVMPIRLPFGQLAAAIITSCDPAKTDLSEEFALFMQELAGAVHRFMRGYVTVSRDERYLPGDSLLSMREIECLSWVAQGKTDFEIGIILGCTHAGVRYHITRACAKLGASNRTQSVFRACQLGYLGSPPVRQHPHEGQAGNGHADNLPGHHNMMARASASN